MSEQFHRALLLGHQPAFSLSEYALAPASAPRFRLGELLATLHGSGFRYGNFLPGHLHLVADGTAVIVRATHVQGEQQLDPERMAEDFRTPFATHPWEDFRAILAGYARASYERIDPHHPGFTDGVLDELGVSGPRPRPRPVELDVRRLLAALGLKLVATGDALALLCVDSTPASQTWLRFPTDACLLVLCCLLLDVRCDAVLDGPRTLFSSQEGQPLAHFFGMIRGRGEPDESLLAKLPPGLDLALKLALEVRGAFRAGGASFNSLLPQLRETLAAPVTEPTAKRLGDVLADVATYVARLLDQDVGEVSHSQSYAQKAILLLQCQATGLVQDEARLAALTQALSSCSWYPPAISKKPWPASLTELAISNSLLITHKMLARAAASIPSEQTTGTLWSAAYRGIDLGRSCIRETLARLGELSSQDAALRLRLLQVVIKNYAISLESLWVAARREQERTGSSAWWQFFASVSEEPTYLERERRWAAAFFRLAETDFSPATIRQHMSHGAHFVAKVGQEAAGN